MFPVLCVCLSATFQYTIVFNNLKVNEVNRTEEHFLSPSGKGINVARLLGKEGIPAKVITHLGGERKAEFLKLCNDENINIAYAEAPVPIRTSTTLVDRNTGTSTELLEEAYPVPEKLTGDVSSLFSENVAACSAVVISGSRPKGYRDTVYSDMVRMASSHNVLTILDIKGPDLVASLEYRPSIIKPNLQEFAETFLGRSDVLENDSNENLFQAVREEAARIYQRWNTRSVITRGKYDTWVYDGQDLKAVQNIDVPVINTIGCGDTLTAYMTSSLIKGDNLLSAVERGMRKATERAEHIELVAP